jgi:hypothetical protein
MLFRVPEALVNIAHFPIFNEFGALERLTAVDSTLRLQRDVPSDGFSSPGGLFYSSCFSCGFARETATRRGYLGTISKRIRYAASIHTHLPKMQLSGCRDDADRCLPVLL